MGEGKLPAGDMILRKKADRIKNTLKYRKHLRELSDYTGFPNGAYYNKKKKRYIRLYRGKGSAYYKSVANRKVRHFSGELISKAGYRRVYDYWWQMY